MIHAKSLQKKATEFKINQLLSDETVKSTECNGSFYALLR